MAAAAPAHAPGPRIDPAPRYAIETRKLTRRFGDFTAVDAIGLQVAEGELFGLLSPNGAGKTTLVRMLTGLLHISSGAAFVAGIAAAMLLLSTITLKRTL